MAFDSLGAAKYPPSEFNSHVCMIKNLLKVRPAGFYLDGLHLGNTEGLSVLDRRERFRLRIVWNRFVLVLVAIPAFSSASCAYVRSRWCVCLAFPDFFDPFVACL